MALPFTSRKEWSIINQWGTRWVLNEYLRIFGGVCMILGSVWLGWKYGKVDSMWRLLEEPEHVQSLSTELHDHFVNISIVTKALASGAVCLDGSPPAYYLDKGKDEGIRNWVIFLEGGAWCGTHRACLARSLTELGSSTRMPSSTYMGGILNSSPTTNPDFYNWNRVLMKYCDGGSFNGNVSKPKKLRYGGTVVNVFYRGQRIWKAVMGELMELGLDKAQHAFLTGCSAGGLASILHCDQFRDLMPKQTVVKCMSDAGFFINIPDVSGMQTIEAYYARVVLLHNMVGSLPDACTSKREGTQCMFPEYLIGELRAPLFVLNSAYDTWSLMNILVPKSADPDGLFSCFTSDLSSCSKTQLNVAQGFRDNLLKQLQPIFESEKDGAVIDSCYVHCQSRDDSLWNGNTSPKVDNKSMAQIVADWYFDHNVSKIVDCPFPCNPTCPL